MNELEANIKFIIKRKFHIDMMNPFTLTIMNTN